MEPSRLARYPFGPGPVPLTVASALAGYAYAVDPVTGRPLRWSRVAGPEGRRWR